MEITKKVAEFVARTSYADIPAPAISAAKRAMLDTIGVALAGSKEPTADIIADYARQVGGKPVATVIKKGFKTSAPDAALANGTIIHAMDYDDRAMPMRAHASAVIVPTILALGEQEKASGKDILEAYVIGREVGGKIGDAMGGGHWLEGWHSTATVGVMASAVAASKILRLDAQKAAWALSIAATQAGGLKAQFGTMTKPFHAGKAARGGVTGAMLARLGFTASETILEDPFGYFKVLGRRKDSDFGHIPQTLANPWDILENGVIVKPCPGIAFTSIDAILRLVKSHHISADQVKNIEARVSSRFLEGHRSDLLDQPKTALEGRFSMEFNIAIALLEGQAGLAQFTDDKVRSPRARELMKRIRVVGCEASNSDPELMVITLLDGNQYVEKYTPSVGSLDNPMSDKDLDNKFRDCAQSVQILDKEINYLIKTIRNLEHLTEIGELTELIA